MLPIAVDQPMNLVADAPLSGASPLPHLTYKCLKTVRPPTLTCLLSESWLKASPSRIAPLPATDRLLTTTMVIPDVRSYPPVRPNSTRTPRAFRSALSPTRFAIP